MRLWPDHLCPGAQEARRHGCTCSAVANAYGRGHGDEHHPIYDVAPDCPKHNGIGAFPLTAVGAVPHKSARQQFRRPRVRPLEGVLGIAERGR